MLVFIRHEYGDRHFWILTMLSFRQITVTTGALLFKKNADIKIILSSLFIYGK